MIPGGARTFVGLIDYPQIIMDFRQFVQYVQRTIGRAVIDDQQFKVRKSLPVNAVNAFPDAFLGIEAGHDD
jgi:hypothetical protein